MFRYLQLQIQTERMSLHHRMISLMLPFLLLMCFADLGIVLGLDDLTSVNPSGSSNLPSTAIPPQPSSSPSDPHPPSIAQNFPTPTRVLTYPPTPTRGLTTPPASPNAPTIAVVSPYIPATALTSVPLITPPPSRTTPPRAVLQPTQIPTALPQPQSSTAIIVASETILPSTAVTNRGSPALTTNVPMPTAAMTTIPIIRAPPSEPQRCQLTFANRYDDLRITDFDTWSQRASALEQIARFCGITQDRITNFDTKQNPSGNFVLKFTIEQGWPVYIDEALQNFTKKLSTSSLQLAGQELKSPEAIYWKDNGPCPNATCLNNGTCDVTITNDYRCLCDVGYTGQHCELEVEPYPASERVPGPDSRLLALLVLLVIPIAIAVIVGFIFGRRRQQKEQLKKAFDLRDVRTIGPRSMLSLPLGGESVGIRNQMYDTRSFALAFTDSTFNKSSPPSSNNNEDSSASSVEF